MTCFLRTEDNFQAKCVVLEKYLQNKNTQLSLYRPEKNVEDLRTLRRYLTCYYKTIPLKMLLCINPEDAILNNEHALAVIDRIKQLLPLNSYRIKLSEQKDSHRGIPIPNLVLGRFVKSIFTGMVSTCSLERLICSQLKSEINKQTIKTKTFLLNLISGR